MSFVDPEGKKIIIWEGMKMPEFGKGKGKADLSR